MLSPWRATRISCQRFILVSQLLRIFCHSPHSSCGATMLDGRAPHTSCGARAPRASGPACSHLVAFGHIAAVRRTRLAAYAIFSLRAFALQPHRMCLSTRARLAPARRCSLAASERLKPAPRLAVHARLALVHRNRLARLSTARRTRFARAPVRKRLAVPACLAKMHRMRLATPKCLKPVHVVVYISFDKIKSDHA
jgi:hypothetical protein